MICDGLDKLSSLLDIVAEGHEHAPSVRVGLCRIRAGLLRVCHLFVRIAERELHEALISKPLTCLFQLGLTFLKLSTHGCGNLCLQILVNLGDEQFVEVCSAHRASHASFDNSLMALEAHEVLAWGEDGLSAKLQAHRALIVITLGAQDFGTAPA